MTTATGRPQAAAGGRRPRRRALPFNPWHLVLVPVAIVFALPLLQMFLASVSPLAELIEYPPPFIPSHLTLSGFQRLFSQSDILLWLGNTVIVSAVAIVSNLVLCSLAGYGFASVGLTNTLGAAIVPWLATAFGVFLMRQFFLSLPAELEEAGLIDGCNRLQVFVRIVLPLAKPALATLAIFTLLGAWNDLVWPIVAINDPGAFTLQLGIANFQGARRTDWPLLMAGNVVATLPLIVFFTAAQKQFVATMTFSGLKG